MSTKTDHIEAVGLNAEQCAALIGVGVATWWRRVAAKKAPRAKRSGKRITRWDREEVLAWFRAGMPPLQRWEAMKG